MTNIEDAELDAYFKWEAEWVNEVERRARCWEDDAFTQTMACPSGNHRMVFSRRRKGPDKLKWEYWCEPCGMSGEIRPPLTGRSGD